MHRVHILTASTEIFLSIDISSIPLSDPGEQAIELSRSELVAWTGFEADSFPPLHLSQLEETRRTGEWMDARPSARPPAYPPVERARHDMPVCIKTAAAIGSRDSLNLIIFSSALKVV